MNDIIGFLTCNSKSLNIVRKLGFRFKAEPVSEGQKGFIVLENGSAWLVEEVSPNGRFFDKELTAEELLLKVNKGVDLDNSFCEASVGTLAYLLSKGYTPTRDFSDKTKFFTFKTCCKSFSGVETESVSDKTLITLVNGEFVPKKGNLSLSFIESISNEIDFITYDQLKDTLL